MAGGPVFVRATVIANAPVAEAQYRLELSVPSDWPLPEPGQFVSIACREGDGAPVEPLLLRPLSVFGYEAGRVALLYRVVGRGSALLRSARPGDALALLGPVGHGFTPAPGRRPGLVGGGVGVPPLVYWAARLQASGLEALALSGFARRSLVVGQTEYDALGVEARVASDDGSIGFHGRVDALLERAIAAREIDSVYACGPIPMLRAVARRSLDAGLPTQVCFEALMGCSVGACLSCVVPVGGSEEAWQPSYAAYGRVCREGPVFDAREVAWDAL